MVTSKKQALVMMIELSPDKIALLDAAGIKHDCGRGEIWDRAKAILHDADAPALASAPTGEKPKDEAAVDEVNLEAAFGTMGKRLKEVAEAEYGAPLVDAASTIVAAAGKKVSSVGRRISRKGSGWRSRYRRGRRTG